MPKGVHDNHVGRPRICFCERCPKCRRRYAPAWNRKRVYIPRSMRPPRALPPPADLPDISDHELGLRMIDFFVMKGWEWNAD